MIKKREQNQEFAPNARFARVLGGGPQKVGQKGQKGHIVVFIDIFIWAEKPWKCWICSVGLAALPLV